MIFAILIEKLVSEGSMNTPITLQMFQNLRII